MGRLWGQCQVQTSPIIAWHPTAKERGLLRRWASQFAKRFIDNVEKHSLGKTKRAKDQETSIPRDDTAVVNLHNNRVGRKVKGRLEMAEVG